MLEEFVPVGLRSKLTKSHLYAGTNIAARSIESHFRLSGTPFFREYTDHSFQHSAEVFKAACDIIAPEALDVLSPDDINILILSCMLHDSGLHITEDMFISLTSRENNEIVASPFDSKSWPELWSEFIAEAHRFSAKKLVSLFGDSEPITEPARHPIEMTARDRLLIGEFLRRHHPRFAHEFAIGAVPDAKGTRFEFKSLEPAVRDIAGLIARSHGMELRQTFAYIQQRYDLRDYNRVHLIFLMTLLRIADFLQIQPARAPELFGRLHNIKSPFSSGEWHLHQCIENITTSSLDPEAIFVAANPPSVHEYLKFEKWANGLQAELDTSWAILGEVYGRFAREGLDHLQLNIRRVRTNIEDKATLQKRVPFIPDSIRFSVAEPELLKLLVAPLYGDDPLYGVRELTQNAADSVREMQHLAAAGVDVSDDRLTGEDIELEITLGPLPHFAITDRGTGMTLQVVKDFFLRAGASFRNSDIWKQQFEEAGGASKIARAGRFGVGALSAFLIGERVEVYTRHYTDTTGKGLSFSCSIDDDEIELLQQSGPVGTRIKILSDDKRVKAIANYFHHSHGTPRFFQSDDMNLSLNMDVPLESLEESKPDGWPRRWSDQELHDAAAALSLSPLWIAVPGTKYDRVLWDRNTHLWRDSWGGIQHQAGYLYCNDLLIGDLHDPPKNLIVEGKHMGGAWEIIPPTIAITDNNGKLPLDLARKGFAQTDEELTSAIFRSIWSEFVASLFYSEMSLASEVCDLWDGEDLMFKSDWVPIIFGKTGFALLDEMLLHSLSPKTLVVLAYNKELLDQLLTDPFIDERTFVLMKRAIWSGSSTNTLLTVSGAYYRSPLPNFDRRIRGRNETFARTYIALDKEAFQGAINLRNSPKYLRTMLDNAYSVRAGECEVVVVSRDDLSDKAVKATFGKFAKNVLTKYAGKAGKRLDGPLMFYTSYSNEQVQPSHLSEIWQASFRAHLIPYDVRTRKQVLKANAPIAAFKRE